MGRRRRRSLHRMSGIHARSDPALLSGPVAPSAMAALPINVRQLSRTAVAWQRVDVHGRASVRDAA
jgi:hypothetical protein